MCPLLSQQQLMMEKLVSKEELLVKHCTHVESFLSYILPFFSFIDFNGDVKPPATTLSNLKGKTTRFHSPLQFILRHLLKLFFSLVDNANDSGSLVVPGQIPWDSPPGSKGVSFAGAQDADANMSSNDAGNESPTATNDGGDGE